MKIGIVGGGIMGLTLGYYLQKRGHQVDIYERNSYLGGLACSYDYGDFIWDKFYHVILPQDTHLIELLHEIGLKGDLCWRNTGTGYYAKGKFYSMSNTRELLQFPLLSWPDKIRMGLATLYTLKLAKPAQLYQITAQDWLIKVFGNSNYLNFWQPLLRAKFGDYDEKVAAVFIWASLTRLMGARSGAANKESMGYVKGGYHHILATLRNQLESRGGRIYLGSRIAQIGLTGEILSRGNYPEQNHTSSSYHTEDAVDTSLRIEVANPTEEMAKCGIVVSVNDKDNKIHWFDKVIFTAPQKMAIPILSKKLRENLENLPNQKYLPTTYLGVVCLNVVLRHPLTSYYVLNISDEHIPLTGMIEMTSLVNPSEETGGYSLIYLPRYVDSHDPFLDAEDDVVYQELFANGLKRLFPDLTSKDVVSWHVQRARFVQPLPLVQKTPRPLDGMLPQVDDEFVLANTSFLTCATLNNNEVVGLAKEIASKV